MTVEEEGDAMTKATTTRNRHSRARRQSKPRAGSKRAAAGSDGGRTTVGFSERKSIEELAAEQGVKLEGQLKRIVGSGAHLWSSNEEFEEFVQGIDDRRRRDLGLGKR